MEGDKKGGKDLWALTGGVAASVVFLLAGYVGAYYATVRASHSPGSINSRVYRPGDVLPVYRRIPLVDSRWLFAPMHAIDRMIRPQVWNSL